jgi:hypothetical protein
VSSEVAIRRYRLAFRLAIVALVWSLGLVLAALLMPAVDGQTVSNSQGLTLTSATLAEADGAVILIPVLIPAIAAIAVAESIRRRRGRGRDRSATVAWVMIGLLGALALLTILSIGAFVAPVIALLVIAMRLAPSPAGVAPARRRARERPA